MTDLAPTGRADRFLPVLPGEPRRTSGLPSPGLWLLFLLQVGLIEMVDAGGDIARGNLRPADAATADRHAHDVVAYERAHGLFFEPTWQIFFHQTHHLLGLAITWSAIVTVANSIYAWLHFGVPFVLAAWVFARHRVWFPLLRNTILLTTALAALVYQIYPVAPPRLTPGVAYLGRPYHFLDTMRHTIAGGPKLNGHVLGDNPYAAMPSLHISWSLIVMLTLILLAPRLPIRLLALLYPGVILFAIVVTGNHWVMDGIGAVPVVVAGILLALLVEAIRPTGVVRAFGRRPLRSEQDR